MCQDLGGVLLIHVFISFIFYIVIIIAGNMPNKIGEYLLWTGIVGFLVTALSAICICIGWGMGHEYMLKEAVKNNAAVFHVDEKGIVTYQWKTQELK